jgi:DNA-binding NarL/FixJ family response regulator
MTRQADPTRTIRVLIVDDEPDLRVLLRSMLSIDQRVEVTGEAGDGGEGLAMFEALRPDVLILDQRMPELTGLEVAERVLAGNPEQAIILMSAYLDDAIRAEAAAMGIRGVIGKPQNIDTIVDEIIRAAS